MDYGDSWEPGEGGRLAGQLGFGVSSRSFFDLGLRELLQEVVDELVLGQRALQWHHELLPSRYPFPCHSVEQLCHTSIATLEFSVLREEEPEIRDRPAVCMCGNTAPSLCGFI